MRRYALVIGIDKYASPSIHSLKFAEADAKELHSLLAMGGECRIPTENQVLLCNAAATREAIIQNLESMASVCRD